MKKIIIILFLINVFLSCSSNKKEIAKDNVSEKKSIESIVLAKTPKLSEGNKNFLNGNFEEAISFYQKGLKENKSAAYYNIGVSYFLLGDYEQSKKYFKMAYDLDNSFKEAYINLAASLIQLNQLEEAEKIINKLKDSSDSAKLLVNAANIYLKKGNTAKAYYYLDKASSYAGDKIYFKTSYGTYLLSIGEYEKAIEIIESIKDKTYNEFFNLALGYYKIKDYKKSIFNIKNALNKKKTVLAYDILAKNYEAMNDYILASESYRNLLKLTNETQYRIKYANALYKSGDYNRALNVLNTLIKDFPKNKYTYLLKYKILDELNDTEGSTQVINLAYKNIQDDDIIYKYVWHYLIKIEKLNYAKRIVFKNSYSNDLSNLLKALYSLKIKQYNDAKKYLDNIENLKNSDFYLLNAFYYLKSKQYNNALKAIPQIDNDSPEKLWYEFIANWNSKNQEEVIKITRKFLDNLRIFKKKPKISIDISPVISDFDLSFPFYGNFEDILRLSLTPIVINPDEMLDFIALGYKLLREKESRKALEELKKSVKFAKAIEENTKGVNAFINYDFVSALKHFKLAEANLKNNSILLHNIGISYLNLGEKRLAYNFFDRATIFNRFTLQAYLGKAIILKINGDDTRSLNQYDLLLSNYEVMQANNKKVAPYFEFAKYYAEIGLGKYNIVLDELLLVEDKLEFYNYMINLAAYFNDKNQKYLEKIKKLKIFRNNEIYSLVKLINEKNESYIISTNDLDYNTMLANVLATRGKKFDFKSIQNAPLLKEEIYRNIIFNDYKKAFKLLQEFSRKYFKNGDLYKASMYYFMITNDKINAEASMGALDKLKIKDLYTEYYKVLYFLKYFNEKRLVKQVNSFIEKYPYDFRGIAANAILSFKNSNFKNLNNDIINMLTMEPNFLNKLPLEIEVEDL